MDWARAIDIAQALGNVQADIVGDWYRDPWGWPEISYVANSRPDLLLARFEQSGVYRAQPIDVSKENFGTRQRL